MRFLFLAVVLILNGCSFIYGEHGLIKDHEYTFEASQLGPKLKAPKGVNPVVITDLFPIPPITKAAAKAPFGRKLAKVPPAMLLTMGETIGVDNEAPRNKPTIWFNVGEIELWQAIQDFLRSEDIAIASKDLQKGRIETTWITREDDSLWRLLFTSGQAKGTRSKYSFQFSKSKRGSEKLLSVQQIGSDTIGYGSDQWMSLPASRVATINFMNGFLGYWAEQQSRAARARVIAANQGIVLQLGQDRQEKPVMIAAAQFQRTWERLGSLLPVMGFKINDKDQSLGIYYVSYSGPPSRGFWSSLAFWSNTGTDELKLAHEDYQLQLSTLGDKTSILFSSKKGSVFSMAKLTKIFPPFERRFGLKTHK